MISQGLGLHIFPIQALSSQVKVILCGCHQHRCLTFYRRDGLTWDTVADCRINWTYGGPGEKQS